MKWVDENSAVVLILHTKPVCLPTECPGFQPQFSNANTSAKRLLPPSVEYMSNYGYRPRLQIVSPPPSKTAFFSAFTTKAGRRRTRTTSPRTGSASSIAASYKDSSWWVQHIYIVLPTPCRNMCFAAEVVDYCLQEHLPFVFLVAARLVSAFCATLVMLGGWSEFVT